MSLFVVNGNGLVRNRKSDKWTIFRRCYITPFYPEFTPRACHHLLMSFDHATLLCPLLISCIPIAGLSSRAACTLDQVKISKGLCACQQTYNIVLVAGRQFYQPIQSIELSRPCLLCRSHRGRGSLRLLRDC
jgi:hypothetical protein